MRKSVVTLLCFVFSFSAALKAQDTSAYHQLFRFYYDNDFINVLGQGTDNEYTGGTRLDYYYTKKHPSRFFIDKWMPKSGIHAVNTFGWSVMQVGFTPNNLSKVNPDVNDFPYAGGLFAIHTLHSSNKEKKYNIQTELVGGVIGPYSYAAEVQEAIHTWIHYQLPMGWDKQMPTDILLNLNLTAEKLLWQSGRWIELMGGGNARIGTMEDGANIYGLLRVGKMLPYFNGYLSQYGSPVANQKHRSQVYLFAKPGLAWTGYNAFVDGGVFAGRSAYYRASENQSMPYTTNKNIHPFIDAGLVLSRGKASYSITEKIMPPLLNGYFPHAVGNISITVSW